MSVTFIRRQMATVGLGALALTLSLFATSAFAQSSVTATIRGHVEDASGAVLPGATVTLTNQGTKAMSTAVTDDRGQYLFDDSLAPTT